MNGLRVYETLEINQPVRVERGGDPRIPIQVDGKVGKAVGFSHMIYDDVRVPTVHVLFDDRKFPAMWVVRWHVFSIPETFNERLKRKTRAKVKSWLAA